MEQRELARLIADHAGTGYFTFYWDEKRGKLGYDTTPNTREITNEVLDAHFDSSQTIGISTNVENKKTHFLIFDVDAKDEAIPEGAVATVTGRLSEALNARGVPHFIVRSGGGRAGAFTRKP